jgi:hypothetical protein
MVSLRLPGQVSPAATMRRSRARQTIWVLALRRSFLDVAVRAWSWTGIRVPSAIHP